MEGTEVSIQALAWVFEQDIPSRAKNVLFALANHADHVTGHCFPSIATIMKESSCSRQAVFNFIGLLRRNGFIDVRPRARSDGARRANDYWLLFDRMAASWISSFREEIEENSSDDLSDTESEGGGYTQRTVENSAENPPCVPGESALCTPVIEPSDSNRQSLESKDGLALKVSAPQEFSSKARTAELERLRAAEEARKPKMVPVIEGSDPWRAWVRYGHPPTLVNHVIVNGNTHRGRYFPSLYPPKFSRATGPPLPLTPEDEKELTRNWG